MTETGIETAPAPLALLAELTHRCPLACPYCSNPVALTPGREELDTGAWRDVFVQAAALGVLQVHLSGGEPAARADLEALAAGAAAAGLYANLITSGLGLDADRVARLADQGLDHVQLSLQGADAAEADRIAGVTGAQDRKHRVAEWVAAAGLPLTVNVVIHRGNAHQIDRLVDLASRLGARRLEIATVQLHGWAAQNRAALLLTHAQTEDVADRAAAAERRFAGRLAIDYVPSDHHARFPKPCMGGWGRVGLVVTPRGDVLPCHAAESLTHLRFDNVRDRPLAEIWRDGAAFNAYRGTSWMAEPCRDCARREIDFGGCRCQALAVAGNAAAADPACEKSPDHARLRALADAAETISAASIPFVYRDRA